MIMHLSADFRNFNKERILIANADCCVQFVSISPGGFPP
jgi:hypothetical protein